MLQAPSNLSVMAVSPVSMMASWGSPHISAPHLGSHLGSPSRLTSRLTSRLRFSRPLHHLTATRFTDTTLLRSQVLNRKLSFLLSRHFLRGRKCFWFFIFSFSSHSRPSANRVTTSLGTRPVFDSPQLHAGRFETQHLI